MKFVKLFLALIFGIIPAIYPLSPTKALLAKSLLEAAKNGQVDAIKRMVSSSNIDSANQNGITPLMFASYYGHGPLVQFLLGKKANISLASLSNQDFYFGKLLSNRNNGTAALMLAAFAGKLDIVIALLKAGAQVNAQDSYGQTALMYAILADKNWPNQPLCPNRKKIIAVLLEFGADPSLADTNGLDTMYYYSHVAGLVPGFDGHYEKDADLASQDELMIRMMVRDATL